jgi:hypothetical protein
MTAATTASVSSCISQWPAQASRSAVVFRVLRVAVVFYSLIESAKLAGVEPRGYLGAATRRAIRNAGAVTLPRDLK